MVIGVLRVRLAIREAYSLKDRRQVVRSLKDRLRNRFNVAVAEIGERNVPMLAELGICAVGMERVHLNSLLSKVVRQVRSTRGAELVGQEMEFF